nr:hypothetical protein CFP56_03696 [Quercus suber]
MLYISIYKNRHYEADVPSRDDPCASQKYYTKLLFGCRPGLRRPRRGHTAINQICPHSQSIQEHVIQPQGGGVGVMKRYNRRSANARRRARKHSKDERHGNAVSEGRFNNIVCKEKDCENLNLRA